MIPIFRREGFTVSEVLVALALLAITFVSVLGVLAAGIREDKKGFLKESAASVSELLQRRLLKDVSRDDPPGARANFWSVDKPNRSDPYRQGEEMSGSTRFEYAICTETLVPSFGSNDGKRLKQIDVYVRWSSDDARAGYGSTLHHDRLIVSEAGSENS